jgi:hypothetical protein
MSQRYRGSEDPGSPKKMREQRVFLTLQALHPDLADKRFRPGTPGREPDFVCEDKAGSVGIEIVEYFTPEPVDGSPIAEQQYLADQVTNRATDICKQLGFQHVLAEVEFTFEERIRPQQLPYLALTVASIIRPVASGELRHETWRGRHVLPPTIGEIWACRRDNIPAPFVGRAWGGSVEQANLDRVRQIITDKEDKLSIYQSHCSRVWLVILVDPYQSASMAYVPTTWRISHSQFERVLVLHGWSYTIDVWNAAA